MTLSGSRVMKALRTAKATKNTSPLAALAVTGALEKVVVDVLEGGVKIAAGKKDAKKGKNGKYKVTLHDLVACIKSSKDLSMAFSGYTMASSKTSPAITTQILSKEAIQKRKQKLQDSRSTSKHKASGGATEERRNAAGAETASTD